MEKADSASKGTIMLATVKGDVHDIGKNLVDIILGNNGFKIINLGIKVPPEELIKAYKEHTPDAIGLSGLLVKSAQMMVVSAQDLTPPGVLPDPRRRRGAVESLHAAEDRAGIQRLGGICEGRDDRARSRQPAHGRGEAARAWARNSRTKRACCRPPARNRITAAWSSPAPPQRSAVPPVEEVPLPPDLRLHVIDDYDLDAIFRYINPSMLYTRHLGFKGKIDEAIAAGNAKATELREQVAAVEAVMLARDDITAKAVFRFFPAHGDGETLRLYGSDGRTMLDPFRFGRQSAEPHLCLSDFVLPADAGRTDYVCLFTTTVGPGVRTLAEQWKDRGDYLKSHILQVLALEGAEAFAELLHQKIREMWGFPDPAGTSMPDLFKAKYRGLRVSFGYPACPRLEDQEQLFRLLDVERQHRRASDRRLHDGARRLGDRTRLASSASEVLQPVAGRRRTPGARDRSGTRRPRAGARAVAPPAQRSP